MEDFFRQLCKVCMTVCDRDNARELEAADWLDKEPAMDVTEKERTEPIEAPKHLV